MFKLSRTKWVRRRNWTLAAACLAMTASVVAAQPTSDPLQSGFENPPQSARPRVWWHWMNGNITKEGIKLDLEWMHRVGIGGFQAFDGSLFTPVLVEKRLVYGTPDWKDAFKSATTLADQLGLEETIASSPGWSETGGPWVKPEEGMKKYVWSETPVEGGKPFQGTVAHPPSNTGAIQTMGVQDDGAMGMKFDGPQYYSDSAVVAYKAASTDVPLASLAPKISASGGTLDPAMLNDGDLVTAFRLPLHKTPGEKAWIQYEFAEPQAIRAMTIVAGTRAAFESVTVTSADSSGQALEASDDGQNYHVVAVVPKGGSSERTLSFAPVTARYFRLTVKTPPPPAQTPGLDPDLAAQFGISTKPVTEIAIAELVLHPGARVNRFEDKAAFSQVPDLSVLSTLDVTSSDAIDKKSVIDLTGKMHPDGTLDWTPPAGNWIVLRIGYSLLGITNHPAPKEATGLEVDKLNQQFVKNYMDRYLDSFKDTVGADWMGKRGIRYVVSDSWEAGAQNWTTDMLAQFAVRRGYDPFPWLPVLAGHIVESAQASDRFLWDLRKTIADLVAEAHYGQMEASLKQRGIGHYGESQEDNRAIIADGMEVKKLDDIPTGAMWTQTLTGNKPLYNYIADDRESASVAHIYGQNLAAAESMTSCNPTLLWAWSPGTLKPTVDQEFLSGINRIVVHESALQPFVDKAPGMTLGPCGQSFNRNETWAEQATAWVDYLSRSSYLLQQGKFSADILDFYGEDSNLTAIFHTKLPDLPGGYNYDYINADGLIHMLKVSGGAIATASGMRYRLLVLDPYSKHMSLPVLRALYNLVHEGAVVSGEKPVGSPSLADNDAEFDRRSTELFGEGAGEHKVGKGRVYAGQRAEDVLKAMAVAEDFDPGARELSGQVFFLHRRLPTADIYFLNNRADKPAQMNASFRVTGKAAELWHAETGRVESTSYATAAGRTTVPVSLEPWGAVFVVFRHPSQAVSHKMPTVVESQLAPVAGPWNVTFQAGRGAPAAITLDELSSWSDSLDSGVKYFAGTATYTRTIEAQANWFTEHAKLWIDLGRVGNLAEVTVNGKPLGIVWHAPYRVDASAALKPGPNEIAIKVTNAWVNRIIGDQQPGATTKYTFTDFNVYRANSPLQPSGLIGPVAIFKEIQQR